MTGDPKGSAQRTHEMALPEAAASDPTVPIEPKGEWAERDGAPAAAVPPQDPSDRASDPLASGEVSFGDYRLIRELGRGGMGAVYEAHHVSLDRRVALKILDQPVNAAAGSANEALHEARAGARIQHPYSVGVHEIGEFRGLHYISMEYVDGADLAIRLRSDPPTVEAAALLVEKVARAVDALHENGLIHRDLKPANILMDSDGNPRVTDFGLARSVDSLRSQGASRASFGTPAYMAPEQAKGLPSELGPGTDVFSIGVILYELLCGQRPFAGDDLVALLVDIGRREPELPRRVRRGVPRDLEAICLRCLEKDPAKRYARAGEIADDLRRYLQQDVVLAQPLGWVRRLWRWTRRRPVVASHMAGLGVFFGMEQIWYVSGAVALRYHLVVCAILLAWAALCLVLEIGSRSVFDARWVPFAWTGVDVTFLTVTLLNANGTQSALIACYYILLAAAGFWFNGSVVRVATVLVCVSYGVLVLDGLFRRPELAQPYHADATFLVSFVAIGAMIALQVDRVRSLGRYMRGRT